MAFLQHIVQKAASARLALLKCNERSIAEVRGF